MTNNKKAARIRRDEQLVGTGEISMDMLRDEYGLFFLAMNPTYEYTHFQQSILAPIYEKVVFGQLDRVIITMPFRHSKTDMGTLNFVPFYMGHHPDHTVIVLSYGKKLSRAFGRAIRDKMRLPLYDALFPAAHITAASRAADEFQTISGGKVYTSGFDGTINGIGCQLLVIDDPHKNRQEAMSEVVIDRINDTYNSVARVRLEPDAAILINTTRWTPNDLVGTRIQEDGGTDYFTGEPYRDGPAPPDAVMQ